MVREVHIRTAPTDFGVHYWLSWLGCPRRAYFDALERQHKDLSELSGEPSKDIGTILHGLLASHYLEGPINGDIKYVTDGGDLDVFKYSESILEAERLYGAYKAYYGAEKLKVMAVEQTLEVLFEDYFNGGYKVTGGLDLVVKLSAKELEGFHVMNASPGIYIIDHKTRGRRNPQEYERALVDPQFTTYSMLWDLNHKEKVQGFIVNLVYKTNTPGFDRIVIPRAMLQAEWMKTEVLLRRGVGAASQIGPTGIVHLPPAYTEHCVPFIGKPCPYMTNGMCDRKN